VVRQIIEANQPGAKNVLDTVAKHVEARFGGGCWISHGELLRAAKVVLAEEKQSGLAKRLTLRGELQKLARALGLAKPQMNNPGGSMATEITADGAGTVKKKRKPGTRAAKVAAAAAGLAWGALSKSQRKDLRLLALAERGKSKALARLQKRLDKRRDSVGGAAAQADPLAKVRVGPALVNEQVPANATSDPSVLVAELRRSMAAPHDGDGWRR
jgi:hypothetical protein